MSKMEELFAAVENAFCTGVISEPMPFSNTVILPSPRAARKYTVVATMISTSMENSTRLSLPTFALRPPFVFLVE